MVLTDVGARPSPGPARGPAQPVLRRPRPAAPWWRTTASSLAWLSLVVVTTLWAAHGGIHLLTTTSGDALTTLGRLAGLLSADLLLIQVALMARVPWLERAYGQDELARLHRLVGFSSFNLLLAHLGLIVLGYAISDRSSVLRTAWDMVWTFPGMLLATAGTAALVMVVVTSVKAARRRLRYESWHLLHLYAYLGVGLSIPHELWTGADFVSTPWARLYWWTAYGVVAAAVLVWRVAMPLYRSWRHAIVVDKVVHEAPGVVSVHLRGRDLDKLPVAAGQFLVWRFLGRKGWTRGHPYSLSAAPHPTMLRITVKDLGDGSRSLAGLRRGTRVLVEGPYGRLTADTRLRDKVLLMASGVGITPMRAMLEELGPRARDAVLVYRTSSTQDAVFLRELESISRATGARVVHLPGPRVNGRRSWLPADARHLRDEEALRRLVPDVRQRDVYVCGPQPWSDAVLTAARGCGVPEPQLHEERFSW